MPVRPTPAPTTTSSIVASPCVTSSPFAERPSWTPRGSADRGLAIVSMHRQLHFGANTREVREKVVPPVRCEGRADAACLDFLSLIGKMPISDRERDRHPPAVADGDDLRGRLEAGGDAMASAGCRCTGSLAKSASDSPRCMRISTRRTASTTPCSPMATANSSSASTACELPARSSERREDVHGGPSSRSRWRTRPVARFCCSARSPDSNLPRSPTPWPSWYSVGPSPSCAHRRSRRPGRYRLLHRHGRRPDRCPDQQ